MALVDDTGLRNVPSLKFVAMYESYDALPISALIDVVALTFDL